MTRRRFHPGYSVSTKGHSVLHSGTYGFTPRRFGSDTFAPDYIPRRIYDTSAEEYALGSAVSHATSYSDSALYDTYDTASRSRGRDQQLLNDATAAIDVTTPVYTSGLHSSRPPLRFDDSAGMPLPSDRRAIRDVDGFTKPRNLLSWEYRLESRMDPTDIIYKPGSFTRMRAQVRDAHDKLDRHRQLLDRYLGDSSVPSDVTGSVQRKMDELERRDPTYRSAVSVTSERPSVYRSSPRVTSSAMPPKQPVSELRRRLRRTVCKSRADPNYYRDRE